MYMNYMLLNCSSKVASLLLGKHFSIKIDQESLKELMNQVVQSPDRHYYLSKLFGYDLLFRQNQVKLKKWQTPCQEESLEHNLIYSYQLLILLISLVIYLFVINIFRIYRLYTGR